MKKRFLLIPTIGLPLLTTIPIISSYFSTATKTTHVNTATAEDINPNDSLNYTVVEPKLKNYAVGEKLDLSGLKVLYRNPEKDILDITNVTSECKLSMQNGQELTQEGIFYLSIQHNNFNSTIKICVEKEPQEVSNNDPYVKMGDINVKFKLMSNQECILTGYEDGEGTLIIPDYIERNGTKYFIKQIPSDWSDGENDITGLKFECSHLKKICDKAFYGTNCLDYYIYHKKELVEFPEGLEEIGEYAFSNTGCCLNSIRGYSFPSTLNKINKYAFGEKAPIIDGDDHNGILEFRSIPEINKDAFKIFELFRNVIQPHSCKYLYGATQEMANKLFELIKNNMSDVFKINRLAKLSYATWRITYGSMTQTMTSGDNY